MLAGSARSAPAPLWKSVTAPSLQERLGGLHLGKRESSEVSAGRLLRGYETPSRGTTVR